ncbi:CocE/NonD family hydrolase [Arenibacterium sp. CAU 1754]
MPFHVQSDRSFEKKMTVPVPSSSDHLLTSQVVTADDGTELVGDLYIPAGKPPFPAILQITPYNARSLAGLGRIYALRGYLFLALDCRGRYRSTGDWEPFAHDQEDGHAAIAWLAQHPLSNGRVGTRGHSYSGYNQLLAAIDAPEALQAMVVAAAPGDPFVNVPFVGGAYDIGDLTSLLEMAGRVCRDEQPEEEFGVRRFGADSSCVDPYGVDTTSTPADDTDDDWQVLDAIRTTQPFEEIDRRLGIFQPQFREWIRHWRLDDYWRARSVGERIDRIKAPALFISGWWDSNGCGATAFFDGLRKAGQKRLRLLMGPWTHALRAPDCSGLPEADAQPIERAAGRDELNDEFAWFDTHLRDLPPGPATSARTTLFVTGLNRWFDFDDWPPSQTREAAFYLHGESALGPEEPHAAEDSSVYRFDPSDPTPFGPRSYRGEPYPFDNAALAEGRSDILVFETAPLESPLALVGEVSALLYAEADVADFDLCVKLLDRYPDGRAIVLCDGVLRARFRDGWDKPTPVEPGQVNACRIDLWHLGHVMRPGHALRVEVASGALGRIDINPCTGRDLAGDTDRQPAKIRLHHSQAYPSQLLLPVCDDPRLVDEAPA